MCSTFAGFGEFDGCKAVKDLVDLRLVRVTAARCRLDLNATPMADRSVEQLSSSGSEHSLRVSDEFVELGSDHSTNGADHSSNGSDNSSDNGSDHSP